MEELSNIISKHQTNIKNSKRAKNKILIIIGLLVCFTLWKLSTMRIGYDFNANTKAGVFLTIIFFLLISVLAFPNEPSSTPYPAVWRLGFGVGVLYLMLLIFCLFQDHETVKQMFYWYDSSLKNFQNYKDYTANCSLTVELFWEYFDGFAYAHFFGWAFKALLVRHLGILWTVSVLWEVSEVTFTYLDILPTLGECWWDMVFLDLLLCNGLGIWVGLKISKMLKMPEYNWFSIRDRDSTAIEFNQTEVPVHGFEHSTIHMHVSAVSVGVLCWIAGEMNLFYVMYVFKLPYDEPLLLWRLFLIGLIGLPSIRQYYVYVTEPKCKQLGPHCWISLGIIAAEILLCIKNDENFSHTKAANICSWILVILALSWLSGYGCVLWYKHFLSYHKKYGRLNDQVLSRTGSESQMFVMPKDSTTCKKIK